MSQQDNQRRPLPGHSSAGPADSRMHQEQDDLSIAENNETHSHVQTPRPPVLNPSSASSASPAVLYSSILASESSSAPTAAPLSPTAQPGGDEDVDMDDQSGLDLPAQTEQVSTAAPSYPATSADNAPDQGLSAMTAETNAPWASTSDREQTSLATISYARRYPSLTLRAAQRRATQSPHHRHTFLPLPEREDTSRPRSITFGTLKKASMANRASSTSSFPTGKKSKMAQLPAYLRHTTFAQHFQPEGLRFDYPATSPTGREPSKRRRLLSESGRRRHSHTYHDSDSSSCDSSSSSSSSSSGSGSESGGSSHANETGAKAERRPLKYHLPSRWSSVEKTEKTMLFEDDLEVHYTGPGKADSDASAIRANRPIPPQCGVYYYEVFIKSKGQQGYIGIGVCNSSVVLERLPGWEPQSWGYHGDDGNIFGGCGNGRPFGPIFTTGDTIGCGINFRDMSLFYTKNGQFLGVAFRDLRGSLYPTVGMRTAGEIVEANFGQRDFVFDIESYVKELKTEAWQELENNFQKTIDEKNQVGVLSQSLSQLVLSYMIHNGYSESAKQFSSDLVPLSQRKGGSSSGSKDPDNHPLVVDTERRKVIRTAILAGDIDKAIDLLETHYSGVVATQEDMLFQLRCRKFVEMVAASSSPLQALDRQERRGGTGKERHDSEVAESNSSMDWDEDTSKKERSGASHSLGNNDDLEGLGSLKETIVFGQFLQEQYGHNRRESVQQTLRETFSVLAYSHNSHSRHSNSASAAVLHSSKLSRPVSREKVADTVNTAILASQNLPTTAPLETVYRHTNVILSELTRQGVGEAAFFDLYKDCLQ
ncbi:hypothetical protein EC968_009556 [Mortierella alpina]|nr:hypothetical protein EC968_009556 [Mortierella alpina]